MAEEQIAKPEFKILASGTHSSLVGESGLTLDAPSEPEKENTEKVTPSDKPPVETPAAAKLTDNGNGEPPKANTSAKIASSITEKVPATEQTPATPTTLQAWDEVLKAQGFDEQFINLAKHYKTEGKLDKYVEAMSTDFSKMSPEQVLRVNLQREYPAATPEQLELLYDTEVVDKYKLDPDTYSADSKEAKAGRVKMEMDATKLRTKFTEDNAKHKLPSRDVAAEIAQQKEQALQQRTKDIEDFRGLDYSKSVIADKKVPFKDLGPGIPDFNLEVDNPEILMDILFKPGEYSKYSRDKDGNPDSEAQIQAAAFISNRKAFIQAWINYGKSLGKEELVEEKYNPPKPGTAATPTKGTLQEAFATNGKSGKGG